MPRTPARPREGGILGSFHPPPCVLGKNMELLFVHQDDCNPPITYVNVMIGLCGLRFRQGVNYSVRADGVNELEQARIFRIFVIARAP